MHFLRAIPGAEGLKNVGLLGMCGKKQLGSKGLTWKPVC